MEVLKSYLTYFKKEMQKMLTKMKIGAKIESARGNQAVAPQL